MPGRINRGNPDVQELLRNWETGAEAADRLGRQELDHWTETRNKQAQFSRLEQLGLEPGQTGIVQQTKADWTGTRNRHEPFSRLDWNQEQIGTVQQTGLEPGTDRNRSADWSRLDWNQEQTGIVQQTGLEPGTDRNHSTDWSRQDGQTGRVGYQAVGKVQRCRQRNSQNRPRIRCRRMAGIVTGKPGSFTG